MNEDKNADYIGWVDEVPQPLTRVGACVILADHVGKHTGDASPRGAVAKRQKIDGVAYFVTAPVPLAEGEDGIVALTVKKDRPAQIGRKNTVAARVTFTATDTGYDVVAVTPARDAMSADALDDLAFRIVALLKERGDMTVTKLRAGLRARKEKASNNAIAAAVERAGERGCIAITQKGRAKVHAFVRDYDPADPADPWTTAPAP